MREPTIFPAVALTGGGDGALDAFSVETPLQDGDGAFVTTDDTSYYYTYDASSELAESSPEVIAPDDIGANPGRWIEIPTNKSKDSALFDGMESSDFALVEHATDHVSGDDIITNATSTSSGLMSSNDYNRLWSPLTFRNKIINGNFHVWQRDTSVKNNLGYQTADRWLATYTDNYVRTSRIVFRAGQFTSEVTCGLNVEFITGDTQDDDYQTISQRIENVQTCHTQRVTVSFDILGDEGAEVSVTLRQCFGTGGSPSADVDIQPISGESPKVTLDDEWTSYILHFDVPDVSEKTVGTDPNSSYLELIFWGSAGADYDTLTDSLGHQAHSFYLTRVQLESGEIEFPIFEDRPAQLEQLLCYRYFWIMKKLQLNFSSYATNAIATWRFMPPVPMRITPTAASNFGSITLSKCNTPTWDVLESDEMNGGLLYTTGTETAVNAYLKFTSTNYISLSAEL